jgi:mono/diheme cytochrome c family protein
MTSKLVLATLICASFTASAVLAQQDEGDDLIGLTEYEIACMECHGIDGKGDGPKAKTLSSMPADLTQIAKNNNGAFPDRAIYDMIDGRGIIPAHGQRDMPIWGNRYRATAEPGEDPADVEKRVRAMIEALVGYVAAIQAP